MAQVYIGVQIYTAYIHVYSACGRRPAAGERAPPGAKAALYTRSRGSRASESIFPSGH